MQPDLGVVEGEIGRSEILTHRGNEAPELAFIQGGGVVGGIAFALIPEHTRYFAARRLHAAQHGAVEGIPHHFLFRGVPLIHAGAAMGAGQQANRDTGQPHQFIRERQAQAGSLCAVAKRLLQKFRAETFRLAGVASTAPVYAVECIGQEVQWIFGAYPGVGHVEAVNQRIAGFQVAEVAYALHV